MRITIRSGHTKLFLPVPLALADTAVSLLPDSAVEDMKKSLTLPPQYQGLVTKKNLRLVIRECRAVLKDYRGLEIVHVEDHNGTFVSIRL